MDLLYLPLAVAYQVIACMGKPEMEFVDKETSPQDSEQYKKNVFVLATTDLSQQVKAINDAANVIMEQSKLSSITQDQLSQLVSVVGTLTNIMGSSFGRP